MTRNFIKDAIIGVAVGDALGVPVEFITRDKLLIAPVTTMIGYGTHNQPPGTWSDDTSLTLCLAEMLCNGYSIKRLAGYFVNWREYGLYTAHGNVFDVGIATSAAIQRIITGTPALLAGGNDEQSNGNGSLMRILPLLFFIKDKPIEERFRYTSEVSSITHRHIRSIISCFVYLEFARYVLEGNDKKEAYTLMQNGVNEFLYNNAICSEYELNKFHRILENPISDYEIESIYDLEEEDVYSSGYVLDTLEASLWCIMHTETYASAVLKAVNLGKDTDTTAAVTGGIAGLIYGSDSIPADWLNILAGRKEIEDLAQRLSAALSK